MDDAKRYALGERVVRLAVERGMTLGCAESCTGGLVCAALTDVSGSSAVVRGSIVSYAVPVKESLLGVPADITRDPTVGVVSAACAQAMSEGARRILEADIAVSITGIAGPTGEEPGKPVGTVWFGVSSKDRTMTCVEHFSGGRSDVRAKAVLRALELLLEALD